jgi:hypothetical protein
MTAAMQEDFEQADDAGVVDLDPGIADRADGDRQGEALQQRKVDVDIEPLRLEAGKAIGDGLETLADGIGPVRRTTASAAIVGVAAIALLAFAHTSANAAENSSRMAQEHHACAVVLGLDPSGRRYDSCIRSLDRSLSEWDQTRLVQTGRSACAPRERTPCPESPDRRLVIDDEDG